jgi:putative ABC transport system permease protein
VSDVKKRAGGARKKMFFRMLWRAALVRRGRTLTALVAMAIAATVATALLSLYADAQQKLRAEFRGYGANVMVAAKNGGALPASVVSELTSSSSREFRAVPYAYVVARTSNDDRGTPVVVVGTDLAAAKAMNSTWWRISTNSGFTPRAPGAGAVAATFGSRVAKDLAPDGNDVGLWFGGTQLKVSPSYTLQTGGDEDERIYVELAVLQQWTGVGANSLELAIDGTPIQINEAIQKLRARHPELNIQPIRQIVEGEANVLGKTRSTLLLATAIVVFTAALCVLATLLSWVLDRRRDFAVMKALGASQRLITAFFATEASLIGALGSLAGFVFGIVVAIAIGRASFGTAVSPQFALLPAVVLAGAGIALLAALTPMAMLRRIQPAAILRGE